MISRSAVNNESLDLVANKATALGSAYRKESESAFAGAYENEATSALSRMVGNEMAGSNPGLARVESALGLVDRISDPSAQLTQFRKVSGASNSQATLSAVAERAANFAQAFERQSNTGFAMVYKNEGDAAVKRMIELS